jgi:arginase family enzyme
VQKIISQIDKKINSDKLYLSFDIDVLDPAFAPGTSTPEPFGLNPFEILRIIKHFSKKIIGCDITEVCPPFDNGQTAILAAKFIRYIIENQ